MKNLIISTAIILSSFQLTTAQSNNYTVNQFVIEKALEDGVMQLNWVSNKEVNSSYYLIEKSLDGNTFTTIGTQKAGSSTYQQTSYSFEDVATDVSLATYRITLVTMDGSRISAISDSSLQENVANAIAQ